MFKATDGITLPTIHHRIPAAAGVVSRESRHPQLPDRDGVHELPRAVHRCGVVLHPRSGNGGTRHRDRWRRPLRRRRGRPQLVLVPRQPHDGPRGSTGVHHRRGSLGPHRARARSSTRCSRRASCPTSSGRLVRGELAVRRDLEDRPATDRQAGQVRDDHARAASRSRSATSTTAISASASWAFSDAMNAELTEVAAQVAG